MITAKVIGTEQVVERIKGVFPTLRDELRAFAKEFMVNTAYYVQSAKLSGQMLKHRTGTLSESIFRGSSVSEQGGNEIVTIGTNVEYAAIHEFGYNGPESVKAHLRMMSQAFGRPVANPRKIEIGAFTREMHMPERSFLRSTLKDKAEDFRQGLREVTNRAVNK